MSLKSWLKASTLSAMLGFGAAAGVNAQDVDPELKTDTTVVQNAPDQETDWSKVKIDRAQISINDKAMPANMMQYIARDAVFDDAQDALDLNTKVQRMLENKDPTFRRIVMGMTRSDITDETSVSVQAFDGDKQVASFDADDISENAAPAAKPPANETPTRSRSRSRNGVEPN
tara:strand:+ start:787 stop:1305 length:519 start_codon:yes stop_codon:yes gene_type:complete